MADVPGPHDEAPDAPPVNQEGAESDREAADRAILNEEFSASDQAIIEEVFGPPTRKGALRRGFKVLPRMLPYLRPYRKLAVVSVVLTILLAVVALAEPWPLAFVVDSIIGHKSAPGWVSSIFGSGVGGEIALAVGATLFLAALAGAMTVWNEYLSTSIDQRMVLDFRSDMFDHAQKLSLAFHDSESKGILMFRINTQASAMGQIVVAIPELAQNLLTVLGMAYIALRINPLLAFLALGTTPFVVYSTTFYTDRIEPRLYRVRGLGAINLAIVYEAMVMIRVVLAFGTQRREWKKFREQGESFVNETVGLTVRQTAFKLVVQVITSAGTASVIGVGAYQAINGQITAGELLVVVSYIHQVYQPLEGLTNTITNFQQWFINLLMSYDLMDIEPEVTEKPGAKPLGRSQGDIEVENLTFGYPGRPDVLKGISVQIPPGRAVAIVGPTGAGKSTLASLLPRFYDALEGSVRIDGDDVRDLKLADVRSQFSVVLQEPRLFSGTVANNIRYGKPDAPMEEVIEAAQAANAHDFISEMPDGYNTLLGEGGAQMSGGERQRVAVARAFLHDAPVLILDEPTSAIDSRTESVILDALDRLMQGRTTILIAHRLSTIRSVDEIVVMDHGEIVERGTHEELASQNGLYRQLWEAQTRGGDGRALQAPASTPTPVALLEAPKAESRPREDVTGAPAGRPLPVPAAASGRPKIVLLGMLTRIPVGGAAWLVGHYAAGFERLGYEVYYVEAHARTPSMFMTHEHDDGAGKAAAYIATIAGRFGLEGRWAFQALHENGHCYGMSEGELDRLYQEAALIINMHGGTLPLPEHAATDRLVFLGSDPVEVELEVDRGDRHALEFLDQHVAYFTWGLNYGNPDCDLPWARPYSFVPSPPPVVLDFWENDVVPNGAPFTTVGNWRQPYRDVSYGGRLYSWSKHQQFMKILDLPTRTDATIELALSSYDDHDRLLLAEHGWRVRPGLEVSRDLDSYRTYIVGSAGEVSAAKEQNVHFRTGWFSERSVTYLAAGRPVIVQDTGFGAALPTGEGLFPFANLDQAVEAVEAVQADPARHQRAARELAREYLSHEVVLGNMLNHVGLKPSLRGGALPHLPRAPKLPDELPLTAGSGTEQEEAAQYVLRRPLPVAPAPLAPPVATVVLPVHNGRACTRLALESVLANTNGLPYEVIVVDIGSPPASRDYLDALAARNRHVRVVRVERELGFVSGCNEGLAAAGADILVLLEDDVIVPPGWLAALTAHLRDPTVGLVSAVTNGGAGDSPSYGTYGEMLRFASVRTEWLAGAPVSDTDVAQVSCVALRRDVYAMVGPLDELADIDGFEEDYARRVRAAGRRVACAEDVYVHQFGLRDRPRGEGRLAGPAPHVAADEDGWSEAPPEDAVIVEAPPEVEAPSEIEAPAEVEAPPEPEPPAEEARSSPLGWVALGVLLVAGAVVLLHQIRGTTFWFDEWVWVAERHGGGLHSLLQPHNEHFSLVPVAIYKLLFATAGLDHYTPYRVVVTLAQLACGALVFEYARRRVGSVLALAASGVILFLGPGWQAFLWPFEVAWLISIGAGVGALLMLDREDRTGDAAACALLAVAVASSGIGLPILAGAIIESLARGRLRRRLWIVGIPLVIYLAWRLGYHPASNVTGDTLDATPRFVARSAAASVSALLGLGDFKVPNGGSTTAVMWALAAAALVAVVVRLVRLRTVPVRVLSLLATVVLFWVLTGTSRALLLSPNTSRYVYVGAFFVLLVAIELARDVKIPSWATAAVAAVAVVAVAANFSLVQDGGRYLRDQAPTQRAALGSLELARPYVGPRYVVQVLGPFTPVKARDYFAAVDAFGSPALTPAEIPASPERARQAADRELIAAYGLRAVPAPAGSRPGSPATVDFESGGTVLRRGGCLVLRARPGHRASVDLTIPRGGLRLDAEGGPSTVALRRFATTFPKAGPAARPVPGIVVIRAGSPQLIRIPRDRATRPWHAQVGTGAGDVTICGLGPGAG